MIHLDKDIPDFSNISITNQTDDLIAYGGNVSPDYLLNAYSNGFFPWYNPGEEILWWNPDPRFVLFPSELRISKSMKKILRNNTFGFTENLHFLDVIKHCGAVKRKEQDGTWISDELLEGFCKLNKQGYAKSVEVWQDNLLVGGFYGLQLGSIFCGESMFSKVSNASKAGFIYFVEKYKNHLTLIDCQVYTEHLESLGAEMISREQYLQILKQHL